MTTATEQPTELVASEPNQKPGEFVNPYKRNISVTPEFLQKYSIKRQGQDVVLVKGLMHLAHERGFKSIKTRFTQVATAETNWTAYAETEVVDEFGRVFVEAGDANDGNVGGGVKAHFPRMALTRSKGRALRDALGLQLLVDEELEVMIQTSQNSYGGDALMTREQGQKMADLRAKKGRERDWVMTTVSVLFDKLDPRDMTERECDILIYLLEELPDVAATVPA